MGVVFNIQKYSIHDGPGIRTTVFLKGCPLKCKWCHNPESQCFSKELMFYENKCIGCGYCTKVCTNKVIVKTDKGIISDNNLCISCGACSEICPTNARAMVGKDMTKDEVIKEIDKDRVFYDESKGGVTFSGGEPLMQGDFLQSILMDCKNKRLHTALDTSGFASKEILEKIVDYVDLFLYDIKAIDDEIHKQYVGVSNKIILDNLRYLISLGKRVFIRIPVIPTINDSEEEINNFINFLSEVRGFEQINLLPYHHISSEKYKRLNKEYELENIKEPTEERMNQIKGNFEKEGFKVIIGG